MLTDKIEIRPGRSLHINIHKNESTEAVAFLFHGLGGRGDQWREQVTTLQQHYTLIIPDLLGHGKSDKPEPDKTNPYCFPAFDQDCVAIFKRYAGKKNLVIGHSYGAALTVRLALQYPADINSLILLAPMPCAPSFEIPLLFRLPLWAMTLFRPLLERQFQQLAFDPEDSPVLLNEELKATQENPMYMIKSMVIGMKNIPTVNLSQLFIPTLMISGEKDKLILPSIQKNFYQSLPNIELITIHNAAHLPQLEQPQQTNSAILKFTNDKFKKNA